MEVVSAFFSSVIAKIGIMSIFGGLAHALNARREGKVRSTGDVILLAILSAFFGFIIGLIGVSFFKENIYAISAMSGIGGWLGVESKTLLQSWLGAVINKK